MKEILYKYRSLANFERFLDILLNKRLYGAVYNTLNDPMEGYFKGDNLIDSEWQRLREERKNLRICSFAGNHTSNLLWSHYADEHRGCCIAVEVPDRCKWQRWDVNYVSQPPVISTGTPAGDAIKTICSTKSDFWAYEQEVRFVKPVANNRQSPFLPVRILEIYLGVRVSDERERLIRRLVEQINCCSKEPIEVYKLRRENVCFYTNW